MARTRAEWEALYTAPAVAAGFIISAVAQWMGLRNITISIAMRLEEIIEIHKTDINNTLATKQAGSIYWYPDAIKKFQYGDSLVIIDGVRQYAVIDATKQIIKVVSMRANSEGGMDVKLAKDDGAGNLIQLTAPELAEADAYIDNVFSPDENYNAISLPGDVVKTIIVAKYDASLYNKQTVLDGIAAALQAFKLNFGFDPTFYYSQLYEDLMAVPGMKRLDLQIDMVLNSGAEIITNMNTEHIMPAGYFNYDVASSLVLNPA